MKLVKLEIVGFKSFADKVEFDFDSGITVFVGPNGCGKSNIVDAIRWILGEQRPKSLRGKEMQDVIFNGGRGKSPSAYSQASLTFMNNNGNLSEKFSEYKEICVSRRLYRSGDSEYLINNNQCRLRDVRELFMDTGAGMDSYSIMEQGNIDLILKVNPVDRRAIFEEAAGISKYKKRRVETERKLDRVEQNLLRVGDVVREISRQIRSTKLQATRARKFKEFQERFKQLKLDLGLHQYTKWEAEEKNHREVLSRMEREIASKKQAVHELEGRLQSREEVLRGLDEEKGLIKSSKVYVSSNIAATDERRELAIRTADQLESELSENEREKVFIERSLEDTSHELKESLSTLSVIQAEAEEVEKSSISLEQALQDNLGEQERLEADLEEQRNKAMGLAINETKKRNRLSEIELARRNLESRIQGLQVRREELRKSLLILQREDEELQQKRQELQQRMERQEGEIRERSFSLCRKKETLHRLTAALTRREGDHFKCRSTLEILEEMEERLEGLSPAVKELIHATREAVNPFPGVKGIIADLLEVESAYSVAVDTALGGLSQAVVTETVEQAKGVVEFLKEKKQGRITLLPLEWMHNGAELPCESPSPGARPLLECIRVQEAFKPLFEKLLSNTWIVEGETLLHRREGMRKGRVVSSAGEMLEWPGIYTGSSNGEMQGPERLVSQKAQIRDLLRRDAVLSRGIERLRESVGNRRDFIEEEEGILAAREEELKKVRLEEHRIKGQEDGLARRIGGLEDEKMVVKRELDELSEQREGEVKEEQEIKALLRSETEARKNKEGEIRELEERARKLVEKRDGLKGELTEIRVSLAGKKEQVASRKTAVKILRKSQEEGKRNLERLNREVAGRKKKLKETRDERETFQRISEELKDKEKELSKRMNSFDEQLQTLGEEIKSLKEKAGGERGTLDVLAEESQKNELKLNELSLRKENLKEKLWEEDGLQLDCQGSSFQGNGFNAESAKGEIEELRVKISRLGTVNVESIQELESMETRLGSIKDQQDDLDRSKNSLMEAIRRLNAQSRTRFQETLQQVQANFHKVFRKLFGGGKADIFLQNDSDVLESGIEVMAKPPGKDMVPLTLLSGGEKVMTAVALLFALYMARPSPFCVLDEVDAALDDANIERFLGLLKNFLEKSQFLIISHNKKTMGVADVLYGITMDDSGSSQKVSMRFSEAGSSEVEPEQPIPPSQESPEDSVTDSPGTADTPDIPDTPDTSDAPDPPDLVLAEKQ